MPASGERWRAGALPPAVAVPASNALLAPRDRRAVAPQAVRRRLRLGQQRRRQLRVLQLAEHVLTGTEAVVDELLDTLRLRLVETALAEVLVDDHERLRGDRIGRRVRRVDDVHAEVLRDADALAGRGGRLEARRDELARLVLDRRGREVVLKRVRLLHVADGPVLLLDRAGDAVVALGAGPGRPLDGLVRAHLALPVRAVVGEEAGEALGR